MHPAFPVEMPQTITTIPAQVHLLLESKTAEKAHMAWKFPWCINYIDRNMLKQIQCCLEQTQRFPVVYAWSGNSVTRMASRKRLVSKDL